MKTAKLVLVILISFVMGGAFLYIGVREYRDSKRLASEGRQVTAKVVDERTVYRSKGRSRYYLTVEFETADRQTVAREVQVSRHVHSEAAAENAVTVHYLPNDPSVLQAGTGVETKYGNAMFGLLVLAAGVVVFVFRKQPTTRKELADSTAEQLETLCDTNQQYVSVDARRFKQADHAFYDQAQRKFEEKGYVFLEDLEVVASKPNRNFHRTFVRILLNPDRTRVAAVFHLKPKWSLRVLGAKEARVCGVDTQFSDSTFVSTDNAESCNALNSPEAISVSHLPASTTIETLLDTHEKRVEARFIFHPNAVPVRMQSAEDVRRSMDLAQQIKAGFRQENGLSKTELERLGGAADNPIVNNLHADLSRQQDEQKRKAA